MKKGFFSLNLDFLGFSASFLCAIHCAALPILLTFSALGSLEFLESPVFENSMIAISLVLASTSLLRGYFKHHRRPLPLMLVVAGFLLIAFSRIEINEAYEATLMAMGGSFIAVSHFVNFRFLKKYSCAC